MRAHSAYHLLYLCWFYIIVSTLQHYITLILC